MAGTRPLISDDLPLQRLPPSEGEQLPCELAGLSHGGDDRGERASRSRVSLFGASARSAFASDHLEQIVEVVGDATSQQTDGFELLAPRAAVL